MKKVSVYVGTFDEEIYDSQAESLEIWGAYKCTATLDLPRILQIATVRRLYISCLPCELSSEIKLDLQKLHLYSCQLKQIPNLDNLVHLTELKLSANQLTSFPEIRLPNLVELNLCDNQLESMPFLDLPNLETLYLGRNRLTTLAYDLPKLKTLFIESNPITWLSFDLAKHANLQM